MQIRREVLNIEGSFGPRGRRVQGDSVARYELAWFQSEYQGIRVNVSEIIIHDRPVKHTAYIYFSCRLVRIFAQRTQERIKSTFDIKVVWRWI